MVPMCRDPPVAENPALQKKGAHHKGYAVRIEEGLLKAEPTVSQEVLRPRDDFCPNASFL